MELRDIEYFGVIAEYRHLGRAAQALGLSQPALSKSLRRLESALGAKLVLRTSKGVDLTAEGTTLSSHVRQLRLSLNDVAADVRDVTQGRAGRLRIGAGPSMTEQFLPKVSSLFLDDASKVTLSVLTATNEVLIPALRAGQLDLIVSGIPVRPYDDLAQERIYDDDFVTIAARSHRLAGKKNIALEELARERWIGSAVDVLAERWRHSAFERQGLVPGVVALETNSTLLRLCTVAATAFLWFAPRRSLQVAPPGIALTELPVAALAWRRTVGISYRKGAYLSPAALRLIGIFKSVAREMN